MIHKLQIYKLDTFDFEFNQISPKFLPGKAQNLSSISRNKSKILLLSNYARIIRCLIGAQVHVLWLNRGSSISDFFEITITFYFWARQKSRNDQKSLKFLLLSQLQNGQGHQMGRSGRRRCTLRHKSGDSRQIRLRFLRSWRWVESIISWEFTVVTTTNKKELIRIWTAVNCVINGLAEVRKQSGCK